MVKQLMLMALALLLGVGLGAFAVLHQPTLAGVQDSGASLTRDSLVAAEQALGGDNDAAWLRRTVESLTAIVESEVEERRVLTQELEALRLRLVDLEENLVERIAAISQSQRAARGAEARVDPVINPRGRPTQVIRDRLSAAGFDPSQVEWLQQQEDASAMERLYLRDRATREGWVDTSRYYAAMARLSNGAESVRQELGDEAYDRYLFAALRPNRVSVARVLANSPAQHAGLRPGDKIVRYDGQRVFATQDLLSISANANAGDTVELEILRQGRPVELRIPRGPLGIESNLEVVDPAAGVGGSAPVE